MSWYRTGTVTVTNGSRSVTGAGTAWFSIITGGWGFRGPDGRVYEIESVSSDTAMLLAENYLGTTLAGQAYAAYPTQALTRSLTERVSELITTFTGFVTTRLAGLFGAGSVSAPGVAREGDANTGIYWPGDDEIAVATGGVERLKMAQGNFLLNGASATLGAGYTNFHARGSTGAIVEVSNGTHSGGLDMSSGGVRAGSRTAIPFSLITDNAERMRIDASGNLGLGTATPSARLHIDTTAGGSGLIVGQPNQTGSQVNIGIGYRTAGLPFVGTNTSSNPLEIGTRSAAATIFVTSDTERMRIDASGNVLLNNDNAGTKLIAGRAAGGAVGIRSNSGTTDRGLLLGRIDNNGLFTEDARIDASGNLGVGTASPAAKLDVRGVNSVLSVFASDQSGSAVMNTRNSAAGNATQWYVSHVNENVITGNARGGYHAFWTDGAERMRITSLGQVGIGTVPDAGVALDVDAGATRLQLSAFSLILNGEDAGGGVARSFRFRPSTTTADANAFNLGFYGNANVAEYGFMAFPTADPSGYDSTKIVAIRRDSGFFGVGTVSPGSRLQVNGDAAVTTEVSTSTRTYIRGGYFPSGYGARIAFESNAAAHSDAEMIFERAASVGSWVESCRLDRSGRLIQTLSTSVPTLQTNRQLVFTMVSNTVLRVSMRGDDGVQRSVDWNLS